MPEPDEPSMPPAEAAIADVDKPAETVSGVLAKVRFTVRFEDATTAQDATTADREESADSDALGLLAPHAGDMRDVARMHFLAALRVPSVEVDPVMMRRGSVEILLVLSTVAAVVSNYNTIVRGIGEAIENTRRAFSALLEAVLGTRPGLSTHTISSSWTPGPALLDLQASSYVGPAPTMGLSLQGGAGRRRLPAALRLWLIQTGLIIVGIVLLVWLLIRQY